MTAQPEQSLALDLDLEYSPSSVVTDAAAVLADGRALSDGVREQLTCTLDIAYGPRATHRLDLFPAARPDGSMLVFVHGGHWQESSRQDSSYVAPALVELGTTVAVLGYGLAPAHDLVSMVESVRLALHWVSGHAAEFNIDPARIVAAGSSAGAHLVAMATASKTPGAVPVAAALLLSGVYDLEPIVSTYINDKIGLDPGSAAEQSPLHRLPLLADNVILARGEHETREYARQQVNFGARAREAGNQVSELVIAGHNHFDLPMSLASPHAILTRLARRVAIR